MTETKICSFITEDYFGAKIKQLAIGYGILDSISMLSIICLLFVYCRRVMSVIFVWFFFSIAFIPSPALMVKYGFPLITIRVIRIVEWAHYNHLLSPQVFVLSNEPIISNSVKISACVHLHFSLYRAIPSAGSSQLPRQRSSTGGRHAIRCTSTKFPNYARRRNASGWRKSAYNGRQ